MSRVSLNRRLDRIRDALLPVGSLAWRIDRLSADLKRAHQLWGKRCDDIILRNQKRGGGNLYEMLLAGDYIMPPMPMDVERALWPEGQSKYAIKVGMTDVEASQIWTAFLEAGDA